MTNQELKQYMKKRKIYQWRVAEKLGIQETALSKRFRHEIDGTEKKIIIDIIDELYRQDHADEIECTSAPDELEKNDIFDELFKELEYQQ